MKPLPIPARAAEENAPADATRRYNFCGEGFELRTDGWGAIRAAKGMFLSTDARQNADAYHKDMNEAVNALQDATTSHEQTTGFAKDHKAQEAETDGDAAVHGLRVQVAEVRGFGRPQEELTAPHIVFSSPQGIALTSGGGAHIHTRANTAVSAGERMTVSAGKSFLVSALDRVSLFAHGLGMRLFAGRGKVEIQAQSDALDVIAQKVARLISAKGGIHISAPKEILLNGGGSYIKINHKGVEYGTAGKWTVKSGSHNELGPKKMDYLKPALPNEDMELEVPPIGLPFVLVPEPGHPALPHEKYTIYCRGEKYDEGHSDEAGRLFFELDPEEREYELEMVSGHRFAVEVKDTHGTGREGRHEALSREGFRGFVDCGDIFEDILARRWESLHGRSAKGDGEQ
jgi:uncharacterized protein (DUF2345 family)